MWDAQAGLKRASGAREIDLAVLKGSRECGNPLVTFGEGQAGYRAEEGGIDVPK